MALINMIFKKNFKRVKTGKQMISSINSSGIKYIICPIFNYFFPFILIRNNQLTSIFSNHLKRLLMGQFLILSI